MKAVFKLHADCGRMGELTGLFIADKEAVEWLKTSKIKVYFGEVLGKHSEIYGALDDTDISLVSDDPAVLQVIMDHELYNGFDPFDYTALDAEELMGHKFQDDLTIQEIYAILNEG